MAHLAWILREPASPNATALWRSRQVVGTELGESFDGQPAVVPGLPGKELPCTARFCQRVCQILRKDGVMPVLKPKQALFSTTKLSGSHPIGFLR